MFNDFEVTMKNNKIDLKNLRINYSLNKINYNDLSENPFNQFKIWLKDAMNNKIRDCNAMVLSTFDSINGVTSRVVLLKEIKENKFIFFTNYNSLKAKQIKNNNIVSLCFYWNDLERQIRIRGIANKLPNDESTSYFNLRPEESKIAAIISNQSSYINIDEKLEDKLLEFNKNKISKPDHWGGYAIEPHYFEFWQGRENRLHDRFEYDKKGLCWKIKRLSP